MKPARIEALTWVLIYAGLLALCLAWFVAREGGATLALLLAIGGAAAVVAGAVLIYLRSRLPDERKAP
jgi:hypothetical protein